MFRATQLLIFQILALAVVTRAQLLIDDSDSSTLQYIVNPSASAKWGPFGDDTGEQLSLIMPNGSFFTVDNSQCYDRTYTYAACHTSDGCSVIVPFQGSGATVYVLQAGDQGINVSATVDGGSPTISVLSPVAAPGQRARVQLFDVQSLTSGSHSLTVTVLDWDGIFSGMMLDYIAINQAVVAHPSPSPSPTPSPTPAGSTAATSAASAATTSAGSTTGTSSGSAAATTSTGSTAATSSVFTAVTVSGSVWSTFVGPAEATSLMSVAASRSSASVAATSAGSAAAATTSKSTLHSTSHIGVIAGSVAGGVAGGVAVIAIVLFLCIRQKRNSEGQFGSSAQLLGVAPMHPNPESFSPSPQSFSISNPTMTSSSNLSPTILNPLTTPTTNTASEITHGSASGHPHRLAAESMPAPATAPRASVQLTNEQADLVNTLHRRNIPSSAIARMMQRMLHGGGGEASSVQEFDYDIAPPSYQPPDT